MRLLLNQQHANTVTRNLRYYEYLFAARRDKMHSYLEAIVHLKTVEEQIAQAVAGLLSAQTQIEQERTVLLGKRDERKQVLTALDTELQNKGNALAQLEHDRLALQKVIDEIEKQRQLAQAKEQQRLQEEQRLQQEKEKTAGEQQAAAITPPKEIMPDAETKLPEAETAKPAEKASTAYSSQDLARLQTQSFAQRKGSMPWPIRGSVISHFGAARQGSVKWDGMRVRAQAGSDVRAVHYGRVMYADWLRGQGMLVILDHGDGYMSLYAHNDSLLHEPGEWVQAGEAIARAGNSGGEKESGLYFEIRKDGQPVNPQPWLGK
jgi:septal ring factor EnvC (AmiA/AmiB activator)